MQRHAGALCVVAGGFLALAGATDAQSLFREAGRYSLGISEGAAIPVIAVADVGSPSGQPDGFLDVLTVDAFNPRIVVRFGNQAGTFNSGTTVSLEPVDTQVTALLAARFDTADTVDLLVADGAGVRLLRGTGGRPPFQTPGPVVQAGRGPVALAAAHIDHDGNMDAIVVDAGDGTTGAVTILLGNGGGTFTALAPVNTTGAGSSAVTFGEFDADGQTDLAVTNASSNNVTILKGDGHGGFTVAQTVDLVDSLGNSAGQQPTAIGAQDLNGDSRLDLVVANSSSDNVAVLDGLPNGRFAPPRFFPSGSVQSVPNGLALMRVDADPNMDLLVSNERSGDVSVLLGDGHGNFGSPRAFVADVEPQAMAAADFNGDGLVDVVTVNQGSGTPDLAVLLGRGGGVLGGVENLVPPTNATAVAAGDIDDDGVADLVVGYAGGALEVYRSDPARRFVPVNSLQLAGDAVALALGDVNGDGLVDIIALEDAKLSLFVSRGDYDFVSAGTQAVGPGAAAMTIGDWNGDLRPDVAVAVRTNSSPGGVDVLLSGQSGMFAPATRVGAGTDAVAIESGDFNGDRHPDLVVANGSSRALALLLGNGDGTFGAPASVATSGIPQGLATADFDGDGFDDIAVAQYPNLPEVLYGNGQGGFAAVSLAVSGPVLSLARRDLTGDLLADLLAPDQSSSMVQVLTSRGQTRQFGSASVMVGRQPGTAVTSADFNGDGRYDVVAANTAAAPSVALATNIGATPVLRGDGNGDGVVSAADVIAVLRKLADGYGSRPEDAKKGTYAAALGIDANGDGVVTPQDARGVIHRLFDAVRGGVSVGL